MNYDFDKIKSDTEYSPIPRKIRINLKLTINSLLNEKDKNTCNQNAYCLYLNKIYVIVDKWNKLRLKTCKIAEQLSNLLRKNKYFRL